MTTTSPPRPTTAPPSPVHVRHRHPSSPPGGGPVGVVLLPLRLFLAAGWLRAGVEKVIDPDWWTGATLDAFLAEQEQMMLPFFRPVAESLIAPLAAPVSWVVVGVQLLIGVCLAVGRWPRAALWAGVVLNVTFTLAGRVNPSAFYLVMELVLLAGMSRPTTLTIAWRRATLWLLPAVVMLPFARTLDPAHVIDDPALMLAFVCGLAAIVTIAWSGVHRGGSTHWVDLLPPDRTVSAVIGSVHARVRQHAPVRTPDRPLAHRRRRVD